MNNSTVSEICDYCHVDLTKAELPVLLILTLLFNSVAIFVLFKIRKKSEKINHYLVTTITLNDLFSTLVFTVMWIGGWIKCGCMMTQALCSIFGWLSTTAVVWSAWIVIVMSVTRYLATVKPLYYRSHITKFKVQTAIYSTLALTLLQLMFPFFGAAAAPYKYYEDNFICAYDFSPGSNGASHRALLGILSMEGLLASMATMYFNISIVYEMRKKNSISHNDSTNTDSSTGRSLTETKIAFANVTVVVSAVFCICYIPFLARLLYDVIVTNVKTQDGFYHSITMSLLFLAPLLNPVVYVICNKRYRSFIVYSVRRRISNMCASSKRSNKIDLIDHNSSLGSTSKKITASSML